MWALWAALAWAVSVGAAPIVSVTSRPNPLYATVSSKLRIQGTGFGAAGSGDSIKLTFVPKINPDSYKVTVVSDTVLSLGLKQGFSWPVTAGSEDMGTTLYLTEFKNEMKGAGSLLDAPVAVATIIPTPSVMHGGDKVIYMTGTTRFNINGTGFRAKNLALTFEPPLVRDEDYMLNVRSSTCMQLTLKTGHKWRSDADPGPLKLKRIDTGGGPLRIDAKYGGVTVAEVQVDLGAHGVSVESAPETRIYQSQPTLQVLGKGFNATAPYNLLRWGNSLRGKGVNYTITAASPSKLDLTLTPASKWRLNPANLPGPLVLLAVNAGAGLVPVGPTEQKKGRTVATIFEDPVITPNPNQVVYQTHTHELWITGAGFTRGAYTTKLEFDPPLAFGVDYVAMVFNRTHMLVSLMDGRKWAASPGILRVTAVDTGAGPCRTFKPVAVAHVANDADDHPSGITVARYASQVLYQSAAIRKVLISGSGFCTTPELTFQPPLKQGTDYFITRADPDKLTLSLHKRKKWRYEAGPLYLVAMNCDGSTVEFAYGQGIVVATILADPTIETSERKIYATHTKRLVVQGTGFSLDGTELTLRPTSRASYDIESVEVSEMVLLLKDGKSWATVDAGADPVPITVTKVDTGAGEIVLDDDGGTGVSIASVFSDPDGAICDDSCEWALDGVCDDGSSQGRTWLDDDYGGLYAYDDDYYGGYGYYYDDDDDFLAPVCEAGTDCTDCGGADPDQPANEECTNTCQWANDDYCDDTRTSGLCPLGTDCHDCGPASAGNFTTWDDDGWWDDDETYWDDDYDFEDYDPIDDEPHVAFIKSIPNPKTRKRDMNENKGVGGIFMMLLEGLVVGVGLFMCGISSFFAYRYYHGEKLPFDLLTPTAEDLEGADGSKKYAHVPITPDVSYSGK